MRFCILWNIKKQRGIRMVYLIIAVVVLILIGAVIMLSMQQSDKPAKENGNGKNSSYNADLMPYRKNDFLLSKNEYACYKSLRIIADKYGFEIFSKVRFADLVSVDGSQTSQKKAYFNKIKSKHIDFVLLDNKHMQPKLLIELDDNSHNTAKRAERDSFVDRVCQKCGLPILHTRTYVLENLESSIKSKLNMR